MNGLDKTENLIVNGKNVYLRPISLEDVSANYVNWMNDPQINQYLESRFSEQTLESIRDFVQSMIDSRKTSSLLYAKKTVDAMSAISKWGRLTASIPMLRLDY